jgi:K+-transporting ATPase KdpF subunit
MPSPAIVYETNKMIIDYSLGALVTLGLLVYLVYALIRPERF